MLRCINEMIGYELLIEGKSVGKCKDLLFDDDCWTIRYLLADTGKWLFDKKVLISPLMISNSDWSARIINLNISKDQLENLINESGQTIEERNHLRSFKKVKEYSINALNGDIGHLEDIIVEDQTWALRYIVVDTRNWFPGGKKVMLSLNWVGNISWFNSNLSVNLSIEKIKESPEFDPDKDRAVILNFLVTTKKGEANMADKYDVYKCGKCGNIVQVLHGENPPVMCCGQPMDKLVANTVDAAQEKHVPVVEKIDGGYLVKVGSVNHPMTPKH